MTSCGWACTTWYASTNASIGELPVHGKAARVPRLGPQRLHLPRVEDRGGRLHALPHRWRVVVEVDPRAPAPHLAPHRREIEVARLQVVLREGLPPRDRGVRAVRAVAPTVERAREPALAGPAPLHELHAPVAAGVLERRDPHVVGAEHDDRLVEELVLHEVARPGDLLEPARHLPDARPQQLGLHRVEVRVEVALLGDPVPELHRVRHRTRRPLLLHRRHAAPPRRRSSVSRC